MYKEVNSLSTTAPSCRQMPQWTFHDFYTAVDGV